jgi:hypothetical protein
LGRTRDWFGPGLHWGAPHLGKIELLFVLRPLVVVPLGLALSAQLDDNAEAGALVRAALDSISCCALSDRFVLLRMRSCSVGVALVFRRELACFSWAESPHFARAEEPKGSRVTASFRYLPIGCA